VAARFGINPITIVLCAVLGVFFVIGLALVLSPVPSLYPLELLHMLAAVALSAALAVVGLVAAVLIVLGLRMPGLARAGRVSRSLALVSAVGLLMFALVCVADSVVYEDGLPPSYHALAFERTAWHAAESGNNPDLAVRQMMLGDVVDDLPGSSRAEVIRRLGPDYGSRTDEEGPCVSYRVGAALCLFDSEYLYIWFDASGRVTRWEVNVP
jgi:hypothetical protein